MRLVRTSDHRQVPWRNGRGTTLEIAVAPPGATFDTGFRWRLSAAAVTEDGPFSAFPGLVRTLVLLEGERLELDIDAERVVLGQRFDVARFSGGATTVGRVPAGPVRDLNLMVDARIPHAAAVERGGGTLRRRAGVEHLLVPLDGQMFVGGIALAPLELAVVDEGAWRATGAVLVATVG